MVKLKFKRLFRPMFFELYEIIAEGGLHTKGLEVFELLRFEQE